MDCDFDCPQFYDFENAADDSHPEAYFETRQTRSAFTPYKAVPTPYKAVLSSKKAVLTPIGNVDKKEMDTSQGSWTSFSSDCPYQNTRSCINKTSTERPVKKVSSRFQPMKETASKRMKKEEPETDPEDVKVPLPVVNSKRWMTGKRQQKRLRKLKNRQQRRPHLTVPEPFSFETDKRLKSEAQEKSEYKTVNFETILRSNKENEHKKVVTGPVRPVPERLLRKRRVESTKTMAEQVLSFQTDLLHRDKAESPKDSRGSKFPRVTRPVTPLLRAGARSRPLNILTQEEKEILEAEEIRKYHFKARPTNRRILVPVGVKARQFPDKQQSVQKKLKVKKALAVRARSQSLDRAPEFHARPVPLKILQGVTGLGKKNPVECTQPQSPSFALKRREGLWKQHEEHLKEKEAAEAALAEARAKAQRRPARSRTQSLQSSLRERVPKRTVAVPFSFHNRDQQMLAKKEEKIQHILEEQSKPHEFKAGLMPSPTICGLPDRKKKPPTKCHNFSFGTDHLALSKAYKWQKQMEEELAEQQKAMQFKAKPCTVTTAEPFAPNKAAKPPTEFVEFNHHSETRAAHRSKYDEEQREKEAEKEAQLEARRLKQEKIAQKEIADLRAKIVHKANPIPNYQTFQVKHGLIPLTNPVTPKFETQKRLKRKHE